MDEGLKAKYIVRKVDTGEPVENCFVLRPEKDPAAATAIRVYAANTDNETLASDLIEWVGPEANDPLTMEELLEMDGKPVFCTFGVGTPQWGIMSRFYEKPLCLTFETAFIEKDDYGRQGNGSYGLSIYPQGWLAYRHSLNGYEDSGYAEAEKAFNTARNVPTIPNPKNRLMTKKELHDIHMEPIWVISLDAHDKYQGGYYIACDRNREGMDLYKAGHGICEYKSYATYGRQWLAYYYNPDKVPAQKKYLLVERCLNMMKSPQKLWMHLTNTIKVKFRKSLPRR